MKTSSGGYHSGTRRILLLISAILLISQLTACASLHSAAQAGDIIKVRSLLDEGADINATPAFAPGWTPLSHALYKGQIEIARLLIERGAFINPKSKWGNTPLHLAIPADNAEIVRLLIEHGADINAKNNDGKTAL